jgi:hypothetical protein
LIEGEYRFAPSGEKPREAELLASEGRIPIGAPVAAPMKAQQQIEAASQLERVGQVHSPNHPGGLVETRRRGDIKYHFA